MKRIYSFLFASAATLMLVGCDKAQDKPEPTPPTPKTEVTTHTVTPQGGNFDYKGDIKLVIPKDGVKENTQIEAKYTDVNKALGLGSNFVSTGRDIVLKLDAQSISKAFSIEFTAPEGFDLERTIATLATETKEEVRALGHHLSERIVLPNLDYSKDNKITLRIDNLIELKEKGKLSKDQEYYLQLIIDKRITAKEQRGIKRISFDGGNMTFQEPGELSGKRCLLFVHGWTANPKSCWEKFAKFADLDKVKKDYNYDVILTFGYNSGLRVDKNGATLANEIKKLLANSTLDIVAHSMGGLVSRSAIENHKAFPYVRSLVTLGTPHLGARLATLKLSKGLDVWYNLSKEGGQDLSETSDFIRNLAKNAQPAETNYYFIAGRISTVTTEFITGAPIPTDGVVGVNSAFNASTNEDKTEAFDFYKITLAHSLLTEDSRVILHTLDKLREFANSKQKTEENNTLPEGVVIENGVLKSWPSSAIPVNGHINVPSSVTNIGYGAFAHCRNLKSIILPQGITIIDERAFDGCSSLKKIVIPNTVKSLGAWVFTNCSNIEEIVLPNTLKRIPDYAFQNCYRLAKVELPNTLQEIGSHAFSYCTLLPSIKLGDNITFLGSGVFEYCKTLSNITLPTSLDIVQQSAFEECSKLKEVHLSNSIREISYAAFLKCTSLTSLTIPESVTTVRRNAFEGCIALKTITCKALNPPSDYYRPDNYEINYKGKLIVPVGTKERYQNSTAWKNCSSIVEEE